MFTSPPKQWRGGVGEGRSKQEARISYEINYSIQHSEP
jgi:hypothetical protein